MFCLLLHDDSTYVNFWWDPLPKNNRKENVTLVMQTTFSFIHFRDRISSGDGSGGSNPSRTHNTSRFPAISDNSVGSTPRRDQARLANNILYQKLKTLRSFARNSVKSPVIFSFSDIFSSLEKALWPNWLNFFRSFQAKFGQLSKTKVHANDI